MSASLPRRFGRYALFDVVGRGGMAEIYLARAATELGVARLCVVKQILPQMAEDPEFAAMLIHEAKLAARLGHVNVVQVFDLGRENERLFIAMEYVDGFDLNAILRRCSKQGVPLPLEFALRVVADALRGLDYAHRRTDDDGRPLGVVHRDVSPSNVLVSCEGEVKLCDFGIAHANAAPTHADGALGDAIKGKAGYMSPEHARGEALDARADVFAAGIVLWELLAGRRLYRPDDDVPLLERARRAEIPTAPPRGLPDEARLHGIVARALARDRDARTPSAGAMLRELEAYMVDARLVASPLRFGEWMHASFGAELAARRRTREAALAALEEHGTPSARTKAAPPADAIGTAEADATTPDPIERVPDDALAALAPPAPPPPSSAAPVTAEATTPRREVGVGLVLLVAAVAFTAIAVLLRR